MGDYEMTEQEIQEENARLDAEAEARQDYADMVAERGES